MSDFGDESLEVGQVWRWSLGPYFDDIMLLLAPVEDAVDMRSGATVEGAWLVLFLETGEQQVIQPIVTAGEWEKL